MDEERAAEVRLSNDGDAGASFDVLREKFGEDDLLGEKFGANSDFRLRRFFASGNEVNEGQEKKEAKKSEWSEAHVR